MFKVYKTQCQNCLLSKDSIVSPSRRKEIIQGCAQKQTFFICHKASMKEEEVCCKTFFDKLGHVSQLIRIAERLNAVEFIEQPDTQKLPTWAELSTPKKKRLNKIPIIKN